MKLVAALVATFATVTLSTSAQAAEKPRDVLTVVTAGDSITEGVGASRGRSWPDMLERRDSFEVTNVGHKGSCLVTVGCYHPDTLVDSFRREVLSERPDVAIVSIGRNDLCHVSTADYKALLRGLRADAERVGVKVFYGTVTPVNERWPYPCEEQQAEINDWLRGVPGTIDFAAALAGRDGMLRKRYDSGDGLHPNGAGYKVMAGVAARALLG